ncbi:hypothetical protein EVA_08368 [gut metagenome]|uniref:Uncharacterized protein n=1 Tax=gut metagenome TaxID=749906 RepID=J9GTB4_9ZZZZ
MAFSAQMAPITGPLSSRTPRPYILPSQISPPKGG